MKNVGALAVVIGCSLGCGAAEPVELSPERRICDGSDGIQLAIGYAGGAAPFPHTAVLSELGYDFLYVDGSCHYWVHAPPSPSGDEYSLWRPYREGVLTLAQEQQLHDAARYAGFPPDVCTPREFAWDAGGGFFWDGREFRACGDDRLEATVPLRTELYDAGSALTGPVRLQVMENSHGEVPMAYEWPLDTPLASFVLPYGDTRSFRVDAIADATALRSLRDQALAEADAAPPYTSWNGIPIAANDGSGPYFMALRDELPFADADGTWRPAPWNSEYAVGAARRPSR